MELQITLIYCKIETQLTMNEMESRCTIKAVGIDCTSISRRDKVKEKAGRL